MAGLLFEDNCESCHVLKGNLVGPEITKKANYKLFLKAHPSFKNKIDSTNYGILKKYCVNRGLLH